MSSLTIAVLCCLLPLFLLLRTSSSSSSSSSCAGLGFEEIDEKPTVYEALQLYDFPMGLLPQGATGYDLNPHTGKFTAYLNDTCIFDLDNVYKLKYKTTISGVISMDRLKKLRGIGVQVAKLWFNIKEVKRNGDNLDFSVGVTSATFPVAGFEVSPQCGCGFDCPTGKSLLGSS